MAGWLVSLARLCSPTLTLSFGHCSGLARLLGWPGLAGLPGRLVQPKVTLPPSGLPRNATHTWACMDVASTTLSEGAASLLGDAAPFRGACCCCTLEGRVADWRLVTCGGTPTVRIPSEPPPSAESPSEKLCPAFWVFAVFFCFCPSFHLLCSILSANEAPLKKQILLSGLPHVRSAYAEHSA